MTDKLPETLKAAHIQLRRLAAEYAALQASTKQSKAAYEEALAARDRILDDCADPQGLLAEAE